MSKKFIKLFALVLFVSVFHYSCMKDDSEALVEVVPIEEEAKLITYQTDDVIPDQYIVVFKEQTYKKAKPSINGGNYFQAVNDAKLEAAKVLESHNIAPSKIEKTYVKTISGISMKLEGKELKKLTSDPRVSFIEQDRIVTVSMGGPPGGGGGGGGTSQTTPWGVTRVGGAIDGTNAGTAWIIDSGIDLDHPDLNVDVARSKSFLSGGGGASSPDDQNGHGTHVAGTVAAIDNSEGVIGVAAGATVVSVRVLNRRGSGSYSGIIAGVDYVAANAAAGDVANMSLGGGANSALDDAVVAASGTCPFVIAAGNESQNANNVSPARANGPNVYTVSSMTSNDTWSSFSNYANPPVDYCAPGSSILSTYKSGGYSTLSGTSMAAPHVAGILLIGGITTDGNVAGDPDGNPDPIAHH